MSTNLLESQSKSVPFLVGVLRTQRHDVYGACRIRLESAAVAVVFR